MSKREKEVPRKGYHIETKGVLPSSYSYQFLSLLSFLKKNNSRISSTCVPMCCKCFTPNLWDLGRKHNVTQQSKTYPSFRPGNASRCKKTSSIIPKGLLLFVGSLKSKTLCGASLPDRQPCQWALLDNFSNYLGGRSGRTGGSGGTVDLCFDGTSSRGFWTNK